MAESTGLRPGWALDLTVTKDDGSPWDLSIPANQAAALQKQQDEAPELRITSPMSAAFSTLQNLNYTDMSPQELIAKIRAAMEHTRFALHMCEVQAEAGRYFLFEHPVQARSWNLGLVKRMFKYNRVCTVDFDFCQLGMHSKGYPVKKRTRVMTNSPQIANRLANFQCVGSHWHIPLMNGRASACQVYPRAFCAQIYLELKQELVAKQVGSVSLDTVYIIGELLGVFGPHPHADDADAERIHGKSVLGERLF